MALQAMATGDLVTTLDVFPAGPFTVSFWLLHPVVPPAASLGWGMGGNTTSGTGAWGFWFSTGVTDLTLYSPRVTSWQQLHRTVAIPVGVWHHFGLSADTAPAQPANLYLGPTFGTLESVALVSFADAAYVPGGIDVMGTADDSLYSSRLRVAAYKQWTARLTEAELRAESLTYLPVRQQDLWTCLPCLHVAALRDISTQRHDWSATGLTTQSGPPIAWAPTRLWSVLVSAVEPPVGVRSTQIERRMLRGMNRGLVRGAA